MAQIHNYRKEGQAVREYPTTGTDVIEVGDICVVSSGNARPASVITDTTGTTTAARKLVVNDGVADAFIGIAMLGKRTDETPTILVMTDGVFELSIADASGIATGDLVSCDASDNGTTATALTKTVIAATSTNGIGKAARPGVTNGTELTVHLRGGGMSSGPTVD